MDKFIVGLNVGKGYTIHNVEKSTPDIFHDIVNGYRDFNVTKFNNYTLLTRNLPESFSNKDLNVLAIAVKQQPVPVCGDACIVKSYEGEITFFSRDEVEALQKNLDEILRVVVDMEFEETDD